MSETPSFIERIHAAGRPLVLSVTGGGSGAISALLEVPGASATVLEAVVPYSAPALQDWLGGAPDHYCSERTARAMAVVSFQRARMLQADPFVARGIGATASLATTRPKHGPHRIHVAWQSADMTAVASCELTKGERARAEEEQVASQLILDTVADACGVERPMLSEKIRTSIKRREQRAPVEWTDLLLCRRSSVAITQNSDVTSSKILFPGAFNPLHSGHKRMAAVATDRYGGPVTFEISITNVDKPPLDFIEIADRLSQLQGQDVLLTRATTFIEKARLAPGCVFVVGVDTLVRIGDAQYYGSEPAWRDEAIQTIAESGCRFLVFGRSIGKSFQSLNDFNVPPALRVLCDEVPESTFREDVSSTELRGA